MNAPNMYEFHTLLFILSILISLIYIVYDRYKTIGWANTVRV